MSKIIKDNSQTYTEEVYWNLDDLYSSETALEKDLEIVRVSSQIFAKSYKGQLADLDVESLVQSLKEVEELLEKLERAHTFAYLNWCTQTENAQSGALLQKVREQCSRIEQELLFFELEWTQLETDKADVILSSPSLGHYRHFLEFERLKRPHILTEPEEKILLEKTVTGSLAWSRLFDEILGSARFPFDGGELSEQEVLAKLYNPNRDIRKRAAQSLTEGLETHLQELTFVFNTILADKASQDHLRSYPTWLSSRNLSNKISNEAVQSLLDSVTGRYDLVSRYYKLKKQLLKLEELFDYDRYAPLQDSPTSYSWHQARTIVLKAYGEFHPVMESTAAHFFENNWIDASVKPGKTSGAFSHPATPAVHPYILMNYTGNIRDVTTLAHELGHGVHQYLSRKQGVLLAQTPLTMAETASVFGEMLVFEQLMKTEETTLSQLFLLTSKIDDTLATVFRQVAMSRFEAAIHTARRTEGELSIDRFSTLWMETQKEMFQESITFGEHYRIWWSYIPHFIHTPGYVYAYAFGELLVLALYARYKEDRQSFPEKYLRLLQAGGSDWPQALLEELEIDLKDAGFWNRGLDEIEVLITQAEELAKMIKS